MLCCREFQFCTPVPWRLSLLLIPHIGQTHASAAHGELFYTD